VEAGLERGRTQYVRSGDGYLAYQVRGEGRFDLVWTGNWANHVEDVWQHYRVGGFLARLTSFARVMTFDQRGTGLSDPVAIADMAPIERWTDQIDTVLNAVEMPQPTLIGWVGGGLVATLFAASHPERTRSLVLIDSAARFIEDVDYPWGLPAEQVPNFLARMETTWGTGQQLRWFDPEVADDPVIREHEAAIERHIVAPGAYTAAISMVMHSDIRGVLASVRVPTLVLHRRDNPWVRVEHGRFVAHAIPGARYVELPGRSAFPDIDAADEIEEFVSGSRHAPTPDRVLATVLFSDIVESTSRASRLGDRNWRALLDRHDTVVDTQIERWRGHKIKTTGDGVLATFDGPARAIHCAIGIRADLGHLGLQTRAGLHTGEVELRASGDVAGIAVHVAQRVQSHADPGEILVSRTVTDLVAGAGIAFTDRGEHHLKGVPEPWHLFAVQTQ
jgi:class 3 adenylate cyclase